MMGKVQKHSDSEGYVKVYISSPVSETKLMRCVYIYIYVRSEAKIHLALALRSSRSIVFNKIYVK
jgi:hypothetical protein